jgi:hypothetical protein
VNCDEYKALDECKQAKILRRAKYKNKFSLALFLMLLFFVLTIAGMLASSFYFNSGGENSRLYRVQKTAATPIQMDVLPCLAIFSFLHILSKSSQVKVYPIIL